METWVTACGIETKQELGEMLNKRFLLSILVSIVILGLIFWQVINFQDFLSALTLVSIPLFFASDIPYVIQSVIMGYRLSWAMKKSGVETSWKDGWLAHLFGMLGSDFSVGRTAYLSASLPFKSALAGNIGTVSALIVVDVMVKAGLGIISALYFFGFFGLGINPLLLLFAVAVILAGGIFFVLIFNPRSIRYVRKIPYAGKIIMPYYTQFKTALESLKGHLFYLCLFPLMGWVLRGFEWWILGYAVGINMSFFTWFMLHPLLTLVRLVPVTVTGLGIFELTLIGTFPNIVASKLVTFGILDMINNSFVDVFGLLSLKRIRK